MRIDIDMSGLEEFLNRRVEALQTDIERGVTEAALQVEAAAKANLQGDNRGKHLLSSIHTEVQSYYSFTTAEIGVGGATGIDGDAGEMFGIYVHEGTGIYSRTGAGRKDVPWFYKDSQGQGHQTSGMAANPFMENAYNEVGPKVPEIVAGAIRGGG